MFVVIKGAGLTIGSILVDSSQPLLFRLGIGWAAFCGTANCRRVASSALSSIGAGGLFMAGLPLPKDWSVETGTELARLRGGGTDVVWVAG